jgi:hypothetical protein
MVMARKKEKKEKDILDQILDTTGFRGLPGMRLQAKTAS